MTDTVESISKQLLNELAKPEPSPAKVSVAPGFYKRGMVDYDAIDAVNFSTLKLLAVSAKRYRHGLETAAPFKPQLHLGSAAHTAVLEPHRFLRDYALYEPPPGKSDRRGTNAWKEFVANNPGKTILKEAEFNRAIAIRDAVRGHRVAMSYLKSGFPELTMVWRDPETGLLCKGRIDWDCGDKNAIVDLKSSGDISSFRFCRIAASLMYHVQSAFYADGYRVLSGVDPQSRVIAVEQEEPHDVAVYRLPSEVLDTGRDEYRQLLVRLCECRERGYWPGLAEEGELDFQLPPWLLQDENDLEGLGLEM